MSSATNPTAGYPSLRQLHVSSTCEQPTAQTPTAAAAGLAEEWAQGLALLPRLSLVTTPLLAGSSEKTKPFKLNGEVQDCEKDKNPFTSTEPEMDHIVAISSYYGVDFKLINNVSTIFVLLKKVPQEDKKDRAVTLNIPDNFNQMFKVDANNMGKPLKNSTLSELFQQAFFRRTSIGISLCSSYAVLPPDLNQNKHAKLIGAFSHSPCLSGVRWMATEAAQALKKHWPNKPIQKILNPGFSIGQDHPLLRHIFPNTQKITAVDCQHLPKFQGARHIVSEEQVQALLHENDEYVIDFAENHGIPDGTDLILIRNLEVNTAPGAWENFFQQAQTNTNWKAMMVSCSSTAIFKEDLKPLIDKHFDPDAFEMIYCGENPEAQRIHIKYNEPYIQNMEFNWEQVTHTIGPDAHCAIIVRKNTEQKPAQNQGSQTNPAKQGLALPGLH